MTKEAGKFAEAVAKPDAEQAATKTAYRAVQKTCTDCHDVFRVEEE